MIQTRADDAQLFVIGLAPVPLERQGAYVCFLAEADREADHLVIGAVIHAVQPGADAEPLVGGGDQRVADADGEAVVLAMRLEFKPVTGGNAAPRIAAIPRAIQAQLRALSVQVLAVVDAVVMFFVVAGREQPADAQLLGHRCLRVAADPEQCLRAVAAAFGEAHAGGERFAAGIDGQGRGAIRGAGRRHLCLQGDARQAPHQGRVAVERFAGQRALALELVHQFIDEALHPTDITLHGVITDVAFHQHHPHQPLIKILRRQKRVRQQVTIGLVALGDGARGIDQLRQGDLMAQ